MTLYPEQALLPTLSIPSLPHFQRQLSSGVCGHLHWGSRGARKTLGKARDDCILTSPLGQKACTLRASGQKGNMTKECGGSCHFWIR